MEECSFDKKWKMEMIDKMKKNNYLMIRSKRVYWIDLILTISMEATER